MKKIKNTARFAISFTAVCLIMLTFSACGEKYTEKTSFAMGSVLSVKIFGDSDEQTDEIFGLINSAVSELDSSISLTDAGSEISLLNETKNFILDKSTKELLSDCILYCNILDRNVDISIGAVTEAWGFSTDSPAVPDSKVLTAAVEAMDIEQIRIDDLTGRVTLPDNIKIDLGAFGKGAACDAAYLATQYKGVPYIMTLGGSVMAFGSGPDNGKWNIGIRDPFSDAGTYFATFSLAQPSEVNAFFVSTSGSYEKSFTLNGKVYHHILDPKTGMPAENELISVTVITESGLSADALSTAVFVEGFNDTSLGYIKSLSAEAVLVFKDKTYYVTEGLRDTLKVTADGFTERTYEQETQNS